MRATPRNTFQNPNFASKLTLQHQHEISWVHGSGLGEWEKFKFKKKKKKNKTKLN